MRPNAPLSWHQAWVQLGEQVLIMRQGNARTDVIKNARVLLCTIASTSRLLREYEEEHGKPLIVHTVPTLPPIPFCIRTKLLEFECFYVTRDP